MLRADPERSHLHRATGIFVRAIGADERPGNYDLAELDRASVIQFLEGRDAAYVKDCLGIVLGHGHLSAETTADATTQGTPA